MESWSSRRNTFLPVFLTLRDAQNWPNKCNLYAKGFPTVRFLATWKTVSVTKVARTWRSQSELIFCIAKGRCMEAARVVPANCILVKQCIQSLLTYPDNIWQQIMNELFSLSPNTHFPFPILCGSYLSYYVFNTFSELWLGGGHWRNWRGLPIFGLIKLGGLTLSGGRYWFLTSRPGLFLHPRSYIMNAPLGTIVQPPAKNKWNVTNPRSSSTID